MKKKLKPEDIIKQIELLLEELRNTLSDVPQKFAVNRLKKIKDRKEFHGLTGKIYELVREGFFDESKTIADLQKKLKDRSINKPTTSLMPPLKLLIIKKVLDRSKPDKGLYNYFKR